MNHRRNAFTVCLLPLALMLTSCADRDQQDASPAGPPAAPSAAVVPDVGAAPTVTAVEFTLAAAEGRCNIETVNGTSADGRDVPVSASADVVVDGWALPLAGAAAPSPWGLYLQAADGRIFEVGGITRVSRPDLQSMSDAASAETAGFRAVFRVPPGMGGRIGLFLAPASGDVRPTCAAGRAIEVSL